MFALFRVDASPHIGAGHVSRCLVLADALADAGWTCGFACNPEAADYLPADMGHGFLALNGKDDAIGQMAGKWPGEWNLAVVDHYGLDNAFEKSLREKAEKVLVIDDLHDRTHDCDVLIDQSLGRDEESYRDLVGPGCVFLLGPPHAMLRPEFEKLRADSLRRRRDGRQDGQKVERIFISFGATDYFNLALRALEAMDDLDAGISLDVVLSRNAPHLADVQSKAESMGDRVRVHVDSRDVAGILCRADLALGSPGMTSWERCCLGVPALLVPWADNQTDNAGALESHGAAKGIGWHEDVGAFEIKEAVAGILADTVGRRAMSDAAASICDGRGVRRILMKILSPGKSNNGKDIALRYAGLKDRSIVYEWQSDENTRRFFRNPKTPTWDEHVDWYGNALNDPEIHLMMVLREGKESGCLRLDYKTDGVAEVSVIIVPGLLSRGIATAALNLIRPIWPGHTFVAEVAEENAPSRALFRKCGYKEESSGLFMNHPARPAARI